MESNAPGRNNIAQKQVITTAEFASKFRAKTEVYRFLAFDVGAYLPGYDDVTIWHLRDIAQGTKKHVKADKVKTILVPHFEGLTFDTMLSNAKKHPGFINYLPSEEKEFNNCQGLIWQI